MSLISDQETFTLQSIVKCHQRRAAGLANYPDREVESGEQYGGKDSH